MTWRVYGSSTWAAVRGGTPRIWPAPTAHGSRADGVDASSSQIERARAHHPDVPGLRLFHADAVDHLRQAEP
ncbi:hypothetical protein [Streptomyces sp. AC04842]|uniref:hypothetical protein n=1 Tax=Streptomyces sp. AC04842 TaxID=2775327 RepID=UPI0020C5C1D7